MIYAVPDNPAACREFWRRTLHRMDQRMSVILTHEPIRRAPEPTWREAFRRLLKGA